MQKKQDPKHCREQSLGQKQLDNIIQQKIIKINGEVSIKKYSKGKLLGKGGFAKCFEVINLQTKKIMAAKIVKKNSLVKNKSKQKVIIFLSAAFRNQYSQKSESSKCSAFLTCVLRPIKCLYIIVVVSLPNSELIIKEKEKNNLNIGAILCFTINKSPKIFTLKLHNSQRVIFLISLKLGNLFLSQNMQIKLGDFGLAAKLDYKGEKKKTICGTPNYIAPEILQGKGHSYEVDIWSSGIIMYQTFISKPPFQTHQIKSTYKKIKSGSYVFPQNCNISQNAKCLITKILTLDPNKRPSLDQAIVFRRICIEGNAVLRSTLHSMPSKLFLDQYCSKPAVLKSITYNQHVYQAENQQNQNNNNNIQTTQRNQVKTNLTVKDNLQQQKQHIQTKGKIKFHINSNSNNKINGYGLLLRNYSKDFIQTQSNKMYQNALTQNLQSVQSLKLKEYTQKIGISLNQIYIKRWVDYSSKFGLGYLLSNGSTGVYFNDSTKIILGYKKDKIQYIYRDGLQKKQLIKTYKFNETPQQKQISKKISLLNHFRYYLQAQQEFQAQENNKNIYLKKWVKTKHCKLFRLSNNLVQVNFIDKTELILSFQNKLIYYMNKNGQKCQYPLSFAFQSKYSQISKRFKYIRQILNNLMNFENKGQQRHILSKKKKI